MMAKAEILFPTGFLEKVDSLDNKLPSISEKALDKAGNIVLEEMKKRLDSVIGASERSTGELVNSLGVSSLKVDSKGNYNVKVGFNEPRRVQPKAVSTTSKKRYTKSRSYYRQTNAMIANVLEYGRHGHGQSPKPFLKPTKKATKGKVADAIRGVFDEEIGKI